MNKKYWVWIPGGTMEEMDMEHAAPLINSMAYATQDFLWERREVGIDPEETWDDGKHEHLILREAVNAALPLWEDIGMTFAQAALVCFSTGLVMSTGAEIAKEEEE